MAALPDTRAPKDDRPMPPPRRPRVRRSSVWHLEPLEERALLSTVYGPAPYEPPTLSPGLPDYWWSAKPVETANLAERGTTVFSMRSTWSREPDPAVFSSIAQSDTISARGFTNAHAAFANAPTSEATIVISYPDMSMSGDAVATLEAVRIDRGFDGSGPPPPATTMAVKGFAAPGRGVFFSSIFTRFRDEMDGEPPRFGRGLRPFFFAISPESYWQGEGGVDNEAESFYTLPESVTATTRTTATNSRSDRAPAGSKERVERSQAQTTSYLVTSAPGIFSSNLMIWVEVEHWVDLTSLASIMLGPGEFEPGSLLPHEESPELSALLDALLADLLDDSAVLSLSLSNPLQQVTTLDSLDESSLALTATLLTVSSDPEAAHTYGPGAPTPQPEDSPLAPPPSWAGFVIGLDEAFEANRQAARRWPAAQPAQPEASTGPAEPEQSPNQDTLDTAIEMLHREESSSPVADELLRDLLLEEGLINDRPNHRHQDTTWEETAGAASLYLALVPALLAERLGPARPDPAAVASLEPHGS